MGRPLNLRVRACAVIVAAGVLLGVGGAVGVAGLAGALTTTTTAASATTSTVTSAKITTPPKPGNGTPAQAVTGMIEALKNDNVGTACKYVYVANGCRALLRGSYVTIQNGWKIGGAAQSGNRSVVTLVSPKICVHTSGGSDCITNSSASAGQPSAYSGSFAKAFAAATGDSSTPAVAAYHLSTNSSLCGATCPSKAGWYVYLGVS